MQTNFFNIHDAILLLTALECFFLAILMRVLPAKHVQSHRILTVFFLVITVNLICIVMVWNEKLIDAEFNKASLVLSLLVTSILLKGPFLYFYLKSLSSRLDLSLWKNYSHFFPALLAIIIVNVFDINSLDWRQKTSALGIEKIAVALVWFMTKILPFIYVLASIFAEIKLRKNLQHLYSSISVTELKLADIILFGFSLHSLWSLTGYLFEPYFGPSIRDSIGIFNNYLTVILVNGLFIFGLMNNRQIISDFVIDQNEIIKSLSEADFAPKIAAIEKGIQEEKLFLEANINLERFAEKIGLKPRDASIVINSHYRFTFSEFVNHYRIAEAKRLLALPDYDGTIQGVIDKSGFNSSSAFHRFFKRMVGITPTEFRKQAMSLKKMKS